MKFELPLYAWVMIAAAVIYFFTDCVFWLWVIGFLAAIRIVSGAEQAQQMSGILIAIAVIIIGLIVLKEMFVHGCSGRNPRFYDYDPCDYY